MERDGPKIKHEGPGFVVLDTEIRLDELVDELGFTPTGFFWKDVYKERAREVVQSYSHAMGVIMQYIWQGGSRDLYEFLEGYDRQFDYRKKYGILPQGSDRQGLLLRSPCQLLP